MTKEYQTDRSRRLEAVRSGQRETAIDRRQTEPRSRDRTSRSEQNRIASNIASEIGVDREGVGTVNRTNGLDVFLRSSGTDEFRREVRSDFASEADFVNPSDVDPQVDPEEIEASPRVRPGRRDEIRSRTASELASDDEFLNPRDFDVDVGRLGVSEASITDRGRRRAAARAFESETPLSDIGPDQLVEQSDGFGLPTSVKRRSAARRLESEFRQFDSGELDPSEDVRQLDDGFGLARDEAREVLVDRINEKTSVSVSPGEIDIELNEGDYEAFFNRRTDETQIN